MSRPPSIHPCHKAAVRSVHPDSRRATRLGPAQLRNCSRPRCHLHACTLALAGADGAHMSTHARCARLDFAGTFGSGLPS
ncbi:hypothetical protein HYPSUDRAFT_39225 [Hypholoma sublateritium FD-334 SS-4]|uniref:Uncharacterized protein n=1 Tax=Hypholoma sublateritium (strain FD-334 SS-4) TaxID=945553 RepID=A0A0D2PXB8_HYPSF|nr:hypothetical protein HYPSUDRAFT_39225 [Hypholoma sublateritium FD-334 SS-4]